MRLRIGKRYPQIKDRWGFYFNRGVLYIDIGIFPNNVPSVEGSLHSWFEIRLFGIGIDINYNNKILCTHKQNLTNHVKYAKVERVHFGPFVHSFRYKHNKKRLLNKIRQYKSLLMNENN